MYSSSANLLTKPQQIGYIHDDKRTRRLQSAWSPGRYCNEVHRKSVKFHLASASRFTIRQRRQAGNKTGNKQRFFLVSDLGHQQYAATERTNNAKTRSTVACNERKCTNDRLYTTQRRMLGKYTATTYFRQYDNISSACGSIRSSASTCWVCFYFCQTTCTCKLIARHYFSLDRPIHSVPKNTTFDFCDGFLARTYLQRIFHCYTKYTVIS